MKSDARLLLNQKKWGQRAPRAAKGTPALDARFILESKRKAVRPKPFEARSNARAVAQRPKVGGGNKKVHLMKDGNLFITSRRTTPVAGTSQVSAGAEASPSTFRRTDVTVLRRGTRTQVRPSVEPEDLESVGIEDLMDLEELPDSLLTRPYTDRPQPHRLLLPERSMVADRISGVEAEPRGARVLVTNLGPTVSREDLLDLFGVAGPVSGVEVLSSGRALVTFLDAKDAAKACTIYHQRLLDELPMKCILQRDDSLRQTSLLKRLSNPRPPMATRTMYDPRNVQFIVKL